MKESDKGIFYIVLAQVLFSLMYIFVRFIPSFGSYNLAFARVLLAAIIFFGISILFKKYPIQKIRKEKIKLLAFGAIHGFIILAAYISIYFLTIASAMLLQSTLSIWMVFFSWAILKEKLNSRIIVSMLISLIGLVILFPLSDFLIKKSFIGILAGLFVGIFGGLVYVVSKTFKSYNSFSLTFWQNLIATPFLIPLLFFQKPIINSYNLAFVFLIALFGAVAFLYTFLGLKKVSGMLASLLPMLNIVLTIILAIFFFKEIPSIRETIGGVFILGGIFNILRK